MKRILIIGIFMIAIIATFMFFLKKDYKTENFGNTINSSSIQEYILNMKSYEAEVEIIIKSNKNENNHLERSSCYDEWNGFYYRRFQRCTWSKS